MSRSFLERLNHLLSPYFTMGNMLDKLENFLECPVCLSVPRQTPVAQCLNGHLHCQDCVKKLNQCSLCRKPLSTTTFLLANKILEEIIEHKCIFTGCKAKMALIKIEEHEKECPFRPLICPSKQCRIDGVKVPLCDLESHMKSTCRNFSFHWSEANYKFTNSIKYPSFGHPRGSCKSVNCSCSAAFKYLEQAFYVGFEEAGNHKIIWLGLIGTKKDADKFRCVIKAEGNGFSTSAMCPVFSVETPLEEVQSKDGMMISLQMWNRMVQTSSEVVESSYVQVKFDITLKDPSSDGSTALSFASAISKASTKTKGNTQSAKIHPKK